MGACVWGTRVCVAFARGLASVLVRAGVFSAASAGLLALPPLNSIRGARSRIRWFRTTARGLRRRCDRRRWFPSRLACVGERGRRGRDRDDRRRRRVTRLGARCHHRAGVGARCVGRCSMAALPVDTERRVAAGGARVGPRVWPRVLPQRVHGRHRHRKRRMGCRRRLHRLARRLRLGRVLAVALTPLLALRWSLSSASSVDLSPAPMLAPVMCLWPDTLLDRHSSPSRMTFDRELIRHSSLHSSASACLPAAEPVRSTGPSTAMRNNQISSSKRSSFRPGRNTSVSTVDEPPPTPSSKASSVRSFATATSPTRSTTSHRREPSGACDEEQMPCGPDVRRHIAGRREFENDGLTHLARVQVGGDTQDQFIGWAATEPPPARKPRCKR